MSEQTEQLVANLATIEADRAAEAQKDKLRGEYMGLLQRADPSEAARLHEVAGAVGRGGIDKIKEDLAHVHSPAQPAAPAAAAAPPPDLSKMNGMDLLKLGVAQKQKPSNFDGSNLPDISKMNSHQLLKLGDSLRTPLHPDGTSPKPAA